MIGFCQFTILFSWGSQLRTLQPPADGPGMGIRSLPKPSLAFLFNKLKFQNLRTNNRQVPKIFGSKAIFLSFFLHGGVGNSPGYAIVCSSLYDLFSLNFKILKKCLKYSKISVGREVMRLKNFSLARLIICRTRTTNLKSKP